MPLTDVSTRPLTEIVSLAGRTAVVTGAAWVLVQKRYSRFSNFDSTYLEQLQTLFLIGGE